MYDVIIIGCGIVGAATAYELSKYNLTIAVLEKENDIAVATTKANSAIIHAGYDPKPGTLMARLNVEGAVIAKDLFEILDVPYKQCGALVLAFSQEEVLVLENLLQNGKQNGVQGLGMLDKSQVINLEPGLNKDVEAALHVPTTMIVSPWEYGLALAETAVKNGVELQRECEVIDIKKAHNGYRIQTGQGEIHTRYVINAAGLYADKINNMVAGKGIEADDADSARLKFEVQSDRGEYFLLDKSEGTLVNHVIFQCPSNFGKGVLVAPTVHGNLIIGPNSIEIDDCDDTSNTAAGLDIVKKAAHKSVPAIDFRANIRNFAGNRAKIAKPGQRDFIIAEAINAKGFVNLAGISSPGLSAAPAIAKMAVEILKDSGIELIEKKNFNEERKRIRFNELSPKSKAELVAHNPAYGTVVCRCETVTEGEIFDALQSPIPPISVDGVKRRCGAGMGRCQGGFCGPRVVEILAAHYKCSPMEILQDRAGTHIFTSETRHSQEKHKGGGCCGG